MPVAELKINSSFQHFLSRAEVARSHPITKKTQTRTGMTNVVAQVCQNLTDDDELLFRLLCLGKKYVVVAKPIHHRSTTVGGSQGLLQLVPVCNHKAAITPGAASHKTTLAWWHWYGMAIGIGQWLIGLTSSSSSGRMVDLSGWASPCLLPSFHSLLATFNNCYQYNATSWKYAVAKLKLPNVFEMHKNSENGQI